MVMQTRANLKRSALLGAASQPRPKRKAGNPNDATPNSVAETEPGALSTEPNVPITRRTEVPANDPDILIAESDVLIEPEVSWNEPEILTAEPDVLMIEPEVPSNEPEVPSNEAEAPFTEATNEFVPQVSEVGNVDSLPELGTIEDDVEAPQIVNGNIISENDVYTQILNKKDSAPLFAQYVAEAFVYLRNNFTKAFNIFTVTPDQVNKEYTRILIQNIVIDLNEKIPSKILTSLVESFFAKYGSKIIDSATEDDESVAYHVEAEIRGKVNNTYREAIEDATARKAYQAAAAEYTAALDNICQAQEVMALVGKLTNLAPYHSGPFASDDYRVTSLATLVQRNVTDSAALKQAGQKMVELINVAIDPTRLEDSLRKIRDSLAAELQGKSLTRLQGFENIFGAVQKLTAPLMNWIRKK